LFFIRVAMMVFWALSVLLEIEVSKTSGSYSPGAGVGGSALISFSSTVHLPGLEEWRLLGCYTVRLL
jgi:hypothetical protein